MAIFLSQHFPAPTLLPFPQPTGLFNQNAESDFRTDQSDMEKEDAGKLEAALLTAVFLKRVISLCTGFAPA